jgi:hypothetical protein
LTQDDSASRSRRGEWPREAFRSHRIDYEVSKLDRSALYLELLPIINAGTVELPDDPKLLRELRGLERRWPDAETPGDWTQGIPLAYLKDVCAYWAEQYDWRRTEARLNAFPNTRPEGERRSPRPLVELWGDPSDRGLYL